MADECVLKVEQELPVSMTRATGTGIEKGAVLMMGDVNTAATSTGDTDICAGISQSEELATGTSVSVYKRGIFEGTAGVAGVVFGEALITDTTTSSANRLVKADVGSENIVGRCLQTAASGARFLFELNPFTVNLA